MVTRVEENEWIVLVADDHGYNVKDGQVFNWSDSFCSRMVQNLGPQIAPRSDEITAYIEAPIGQQMSISAYIGIPLVSEEGKLFGTLCAIDPEPQDDSIKNELEFIQLQGLLLSTILDMELRSLNTQRELERAQHESETDVLTNLYNRRGWEKLISLEEERCKRYGSPSTVIVIDLDELKNINDSQGHAAGDELIKHAADTLKQTLRPFDTIARTGGDEFGILAIEANTTLADQLVERVKLKLDEASIEASIGWATRDPRKDIEAAYQLADQKMYEDKKSKRNLQS